MKKVIAIVGALLAFACSGGDWSDTLDGQEVEYVTYTLEAEPEDAAEPKVAPAPSLQEESELGQTAFAFSSQPGFGVMSNLLKCTTGVWPGAGTCSVPFRKTLPFIHQCAPANKCPGTAANDQGLGLFNWKSVIEAKGWSAPAGTAQNKRVNIVANNVGGINTNLVSITYALAQQPISTITQGAFRAILACDAVVDYNKVVALFNAGFYGTFATTAAKNTAISNVNKNVTARAAGLCTGLGIYPNSSSSASTVMTVGAPRHQSGLITFDGTELANLQAYEAP